MASRLLEFLMQNAGHNNWQVFKNNLEVIKTLVECWRNKLDIPTKYDYSHQEFIVLEFFTDKA